MSQSPETSETVKCKIDHNRFCFVCGKYLYRTSGSRSIEGGSFAQNYQQRFGFDLKERNILWSPSVCCTQCRIWINDQTQLNPYSAPTLWNSPQNHPHDCFFCNVEIPSGMNQFMQANYPISSSVVMAKVVRETSDENEETFETDLQHIDSMDIDPTETSAESPPPSFQDDDIEAFLSRSSTSRGVIEQRIPTIASVLIDALKPFTEIHQRETPLITIALLNALQPLTSSPIEEIQSISTALVDALNDFSDPSLYSLRQISPVQYDEIESDMSFASSHHQWKPPKRVSHEFQQLQNPIKKGPKLTQSLLNDTVRDCDLSKNAAKMFASRIVQLYIVFDSSIMNGMFNIKFEFTFHFC